MKLHTKVIPPSSSFSLDHSMVILSLGSCFATEIGSKLGQNGFEVINNPFGTIYNPRIFELIFSSIAGNKPELEDSIIQREGKFQSLFFHSDFRSNSPQELIVLAADIINNLREKLESSSLVILTLGTSKTYFHSEKKLEVGNCHKIPSGEFTHRMLEVRELKESLTRSVDHIRKVNGQTKILLTVSPVRHTADGLIQNQRSKARLILAAEEVSETIDQVEYFPAYEMLIDEFRDYRYYSEDLVHPNTTAVELIWETFQNSLIKEDSKKLGARILRIKKSLAHRPFNPDSSEHRKFLQDALEKALHKDLQPYLEREIEELRSRIN